MGRIHRYEGKDIIVEFELGRCIHTGDCTRDLPAVFNTKRTGPWVKPDAASAEDIVRVCANCPTGALQAKDPASGELLHPTPEKNTIRTMPDGPLYIHAKMTLDGKPQPTYRAAFCRCGKSRLMPFCDESHRQAGFADAGTVDIPMPSEAPEGDTLAINVKHGGSLIVEGPFTLIDAAGDEACQSGKSFFCRCGASGMKPYCDGSHKNISFEQTGTPREEKP